MSFLHDVGILIKNMAFLWKMFALTGFYLAVGTLVSLLRGRLATAVGPPFAGAWHRVAGTKANRAFSLVTMTLLTFVGALFNPGEGLLVDSSGWYAAKKFGSQVLFGNSPPAWAVLAPPAPPNPWGWFWWQALGTYIFITAAYLMVACTQEVASSATEAWSRYSRRRDGAPEPRAFLAEANFLVFLCGVFTGLLVSKLWGWNFGARPRA